MLDTNKAYAQAGVDIHAGYRSVELIKGYVSNIGGFGGMFPLSEIKTMDEPVMVSGVDGVGTKLALAFLMDKHDTVGIDCVAMSVNDIICVGAKPLFFLDYIACGQVVPERIEQIVKGVAEGCRQSGADLIGGEIAEHPDLMPPDEYDIAGFAAGVVEKRDIIDGKNIREEDVLIGLASSGPHSNGYSLIRKVFGINKGNKACFDQHVSELGMTLGEALLTPTRIYVKSILSLMKTVKVKGVSNITGGGFQENVPRILPEGFRAVIRKESFPVSPVFELVRREGKIDDHDMYNTFNMGLGMVICVQKDEAARVCKVLEETGEKAYIVGKVVKGERGLCLE